MKKIIVLPVKNESWILPFSLSVFSKFADLIIIADQSSTDNTLEIIKQFPKARVIKNPEEYHSSNVRKLLLAAAREYPGNNAIFSFDADEIPTAHILSEAFNASLLKLKPGDSIQMEWVQLWKSPKKYRTNHYASPENKYPIFGFIDDRKLTYDNLNVINDHTFRVPSATVKNKKYFDYPKVLHFQFVDFERNLAKQSLYRMTEFIRREPRLKNAVYINYFYTPPKDARKVLLKEIPEDWIAHADLAKLGNLKNAKYWYDLEALKLFAEKGLKYFQWLDIWDRDWQKIQADHKNISTIELKDPRNFIIRTYHVSIFIVYDLLRTIRKLLKLLKRLFLGNKSY